MAKLIGQAGSVTVATVDYPVTQWSAKFNGDPQEVTDTGSGGWVDYIGGVKSCEATIKAFWGSSGTSLATTFAIDTVVTADLNIGAGGVAVSGDFIVADMTITNPAKNPVEFECTLKSKGAITIA